MHDFMLSYTRPLDFEIWQGSDTKVSRFLIPTWLGSIIQNVSYNFHASFSVWYVTETDLYSV